MKYLSTAWMQIEALRSATSIAMDSVARGENLRNSLQSILNNEIVDMWDTSSTS